MTLLVVANANADELVRLPVIKDNSIVMVDGEWQLNAGSQGPNAYQG